MKRFYFWIEEYLFDPNLFQKLLSYLLLPLTLIYCLVVYFKKLFSKREDFSLPIISIGNLIVGGSGKTPITIALANRYKDVAIILRGYKRESKGLIVVSHKKEIRVDVKTSGDEAMLLAKSLPKATVIVSEDRKKAILKAKKLGAKIIFLDDGYSKKSIKKFDILIEPDLNNINSFCLPSGPYREPKSEYQYSDIVLKEGVDFQKSVKFEDKPSKMILITAISKPKRLLAYIPKTIPFYFFEDHHNFTKEEIETLIKKHQAQSILCTSKDAVKLEKFGYKLSILELNITINPKKVQKIDNFIKSFDKISKNLN